MTRASARHSHDLNSVLNINSNVVEIVSNMPVTGGSGRNSVNKIRGANSRGRPPRGRSNRGKTSRGRRSRVRNQSTSGAPFISIGKNDVSWVFMVLYFDII